MFYFVAVMVFAYAGAVLPVRAWHRWRGEMPTWGAVLTCVLAPISGYIAGLIAIAGLVYGVGTVFSEAFFDSDLNATFTSMFGGAAVGALIGAGFAAYRAFTYTPTEQDTAAPDRGSRLFDDVS